MGWSTFWGRVIIWIYVKKTMTIWRSCYNFRWNRIYFFRKEKKMKKIMTKQTINDWLTYFMCTIWKRPFASPWIKIYGDNRDQDIQSDFDVWFQQIDLFLVWQSLYLCIYIYFVSINGSCQFSDLTLKILTQNQGNHKVNTYNVSGEANICEICWHWVAF